MSKSVLLADVVFVKECHHVLKMRCSTCVIIEPASANEELAFIVVAAFI